MPDPIDSTAIATAANSPLKASQDGLSAEAVPIPDQIAADIYAKGATAASGVNAQGGARSGWGLLRPAQAILPGHNGIS